MRTSVNKRNSKSFWHMTNSISCVDDYAFINTVSSIGYIPIRVV